MHASACGFNVKYWHIITVCDHFFLGTHLKKFTMSQLSVIWITCLIKSQFPQIGSLGDKGPS